MSKTVLIAEKEANLRLSPGYLMKCQGYRVVGAEAYITKPFANADLVAEIRIVLGDG